MLHVDTFTSQNWLITPVAPAVNEGAPTNIHGQKWLLVLTGVATFDLDPSANEWLSETLVIHPDFRAALRYAISQYTIPTPLGNEGTNFHADFQLNLWAPSAAPSGAFPSAVADPFDAFAVNAWNVHTRTGPDISTGNLLSNLFDGIEVDVAVINCRLQRVSYNVNLLGYIVFTPVQF